MVGILVSFWDGLFSGAMLVLGRVLLWLCEPFDGTVTIGHDWKHRRLFEDSFCSQKKHPKNIVASFIAKN